MLCRACEEMEARRTSDRRGRAGKGIVRETPKPDGGGDGQAMKAPEAHLCTRCGRLLGAEDIVRRADQKHSQLAAFGLAGRRRPLLKPTDGEDH